MTMLMMRTRLTTTMRTRDEAEDHDYGCVYDEEEDVRVMGHNDDGWLEHEPLHEHG